MEAAEKFNADLGNKFVSFAVWYVRKNILDYIRKSKTSFKVSQNLAARKKIIDIFREKYREEHGRTPTDDGVARQLGIELSEVLAADQHMFDTVSLDSLVGRGEADDSLYSFLPSSDEDPENEYAEHDERKQIIGNAIKILSDMYPRNTRIACQNLGLGDFSEPTTLEAVASVHGLTRERVRQISERWKYRLSYLIKHGKLPTGMRGAKKTKAKNTKRTNVL
jgi:RNA polymerase sigma factor (sigma-70 family)